MNADARKNPKSHPDDDAARPMPGTLAEESAREPDEPVEEQKLPPRDPVKGRGIDEPNPKRKSRLDEESDGNVEDDDATGEMEAAGQDLGLLPDEEHEGRGTRVARRSNSLAGAGSWILALGAFDLDLSMGQFD